MSIVTYNNRSIANISAVPGAAKSLTHIKTLTASSDSTVSFVNGSSDVVLDSTYPIYLIKIINAHLDADDRDLRLNFTTDGTNFNVTKTTTFFRATHKEDDSATSLDYRTGADLAQSTGDQVLGEAQDGGSGEADANICGELLLFNPSSTVFVKHFICKVSTNANGALAENAFIAGYGNTTSAITGIRFNTGGGSATTIDGTFKLYGLKDS
jgi:hypothetical protein